MKKYNSLEEAHDAYFRKEFEKEEIILIENAKLILDNVKIHNSLIDVLVYTYIEQQRNGEVYELQMLVRKKRNIDKFLKKSIRKIGKTFKIKKAEAEFSYSLTSPVCFLSY